METQRFDDGEHQANDHLTHYQTAIRREMVAEIEKANYGLLDDMEAGQNYGVFPFGYAPCNTTK